jgi:hypothetical protein
MFKRPSLHRPGPRLGTFLAELSLIVIGILLALSVDEWRQSRARMAAGEEALQSVRAELEANRALAVESRDYHMGRAARIRESFGGVETLGREDFPRGFILPARFQSAAWDTAREAGELTAVDRGLRQEIAVAYKWQERYEAQAQAVSELIYQELYESGGRDGVSNPGGLMMLIASFAFREAQIIERFDEALQVIDAR